MKPNIVFYVLSAKGFEVLQHAISINKELISYVVVGKDKNVENDFSDDILKLCANSGLDCYMRGSEPKATEGYIFAISWRWMIHHPSDKLVVFHDSILPKYRGFAPLVNMLINGEKNIGVTALFGAAEYDKGDIIAQQSCAISYPIKIKQAIEINNKNYLNLVAEVMHKIATGEQLIGVPQQESDATYSIWRDADDYNIDWHKSAEEIKRLVDAVGSPYLGARTQTSLGQKVKITNVEIVNDVHCELRHVGKVIFLNDGMPTVICGTGLLRITEATLIMDNAEQNYLPTTSFRVRFK